MKKFVLMLTSCILLLSFICACNRETPVEKPASIAYVGIGTVFKSDNGTFCLEEVAYSKFIQSENALYENSDYGYLIFKAQFDFFDYGLKECGVIISDISDTESPYVASLRLNYSENEQGALKCLIRENGDLNLNITQNLSTDLHINKPFGEVRGEAYICFNLSKKVKDYMFDIREGKYEFGDYSNFDITLYLNDIRYENITTTEIGCRFSEINYYESYQV